MNDASEPSPAPVTAARGLSKPPCASAPSDALFTSLYGELHRLARREAARAGPGAVVSPTTLLHEAYLDMSQRHALAFPDRAHFLAYAARAMRTVVIDRARAGAESCAEPASLSDIGSALDELAALEPELANVVDLKFFCGFAVAEIAAMRGVSERTVQRQWEKARLLLYRALAERP